MPVVNSLGAFSLGRDCQVVIMHPLAPGGRVDIPNVTDFEAKQQTQHVEADRLDGVTLAAELPKGWGGTFGADRGNSAVDDFFALVEQAWYTGGVVQNATIYQYIAEPDGSSSTYQFTQASLKLAEGGQWSGDKIVKQRIEFKAFRRNKV